MEALNVAHKQHLRDKSWDTVDSLWLAVFSWCTLDFREDTFEYFEL